MLILSRNIGERIIIGKDEEIEITIISRNRDEIKLGIEAPKDIPVHREEILNKIKESQESKEK